MAENMTNPKIISTDTKKMFFISPSFLYRYLTASSPPVKSTTPEDQKQNNDYKYGFHGFSPFSLNVYSILLNTYVMPRPILKNRLSNTLKSLKLQRKLRCGMIRERLYFLIYQETPDISGI